MIAAATCLLAGGILTGAHAMRPVKSAKAAAHPQPAAASLSLPDPPPGTGWTPLGLSVDRSVQQVVRAKLQFNVPPFRAFTWLHAIPTGTGFEDATAEIYITDPG